MDSREKWQIWEKGQVHPLVQYDENDTYLFIHRGRKDFESEGTVDQP